MEVKEEQVWVKLQTEDYSVDNWVIMQMESNRLPIVYRVNIEQDDGTTVTRPRRHLAFVRRDRSRRP